MDTQFNGQVAIVTGAGKGIGYQISLELAKHGAFVVMNDTDEQLINEGSIPFMAIKRLPSQVMLANLTSSKVL
jgi:NAD(P)-dependent dehydrogenase (short-subunit alcohol dehydrogenase family)